MLRGYKQNKYHFCGRCGDRAILREMTWQNGVLLDQKCVDTGVDPLGSAPRIDPNNAFAPAIILGQAGDRGKHIARILQTYTNSRELQPDRMLTETSVRSEDDISFSI